MAFINKSFILNKLLPNLAIEKLIGSYVSLKKSGVNYVCCCPFHHEKTPSCNINTSKQMFYCFGCKEHGNAIDFLMKYKNLGFVEAVEEAASFAGIEVEYDNTGHSKEKDDKERRYYELMDRCAAFFTKTLHSPDGISGMEYFRNVRGLSPETILKARLGFAPNSPNYLSGPVIKSKDEEQMLIDLGVLVQGSYGTHAMFRNRIMIPIFDRKGRVISFGGRTMGDEKPKYMNTKETPIYRKRQELFGLYEALKDNNNRPDRIVVVEGYMDVISVRQAGCSYAVASLGTATTEDQIKTMFRYTDRVIFCYDGDAAGQHAAWHALNVATPILLDGKDLRFAFLPVEHDPDSLVREKGLEGFTDYLDKAMTYAEFLIVHNTQKFNLKDSGELSNFISETLKQIAAIPLPALQSVALKLLSIPSGIAENQLYDMLKQSKFEEKAESSRKADSFTREFDPQSNVSKENDLLKTPMRRLMAFIIQQPIVVSNMFEEFSLDTLVKLCRDLEVKGTEQLSELLQLLKDNPGAKASDLIELTRETPLEKIVTLMMGADLNLTFNNGKELSYELRISYFADLISELLTKRLREKASELKVRISQGDIGALDQFTKLQSKLNQSDESLS